MKSDAFELVDKATVNRDFGVAEASFSLKLELISLIIWNYAQYITRHRNNVHMKINIRIAGILLRSTEAVWGKQL